MPEKMLVTGGAGFIGSHIVDALIEDGHSVRVFDNLDPQVHGIRRRRGTNKVPAYLNKDAEFVLDDIRNRDALKKAIRGIEVIFHHASVVGVGQSMYEIRRYVETNTLGTANLLDILANENHKVRKLIVASSMSIYGEGKYTCENCGFVYPGFRREGQLKRRDWEMKCSKCKKDVRPLPTDENKPLFPTSIYAVSKRDQEEMCLSIGRAYRIPTVCLRYFNVYGPRQSLSNPYTGVAAIFCCRILNDNPPIIFEDGLQTRDFIHVSDIVNATILAMERDGANYEVFNVGTGRPITILEIASSLLKQLNSDKEPVIVNKFREGDIRHCFADITKIKEKLGFKPKVDFDQGVSDLVDWVSQQRAIDNVKKANLELKRRGLTK